MNDAEGSAGPRVLRVGAEVTYAIPTPVVLGKRRRPAADEESAAMLEQVESIHALAESLQSYDLDGMSVDDAARVIDACRKARTAISAAEEFVAKRVAVVWEGKWTNLRTVAGVGQVQPYRSYTDTWKHNAIVDQIIDAHMADTDGEIPEPRTVIGWLLSAAHVDYWRSGKLKDLGIDADALREREYGVARLRIKPGSVTP